MSKYWFIISFFLSLTFIPSLIMGQEDWGLELELELLEEEEVVESASKYKQKITESPSAITVITEEEIRNSSAKSIAELLRVVPGVTVKYISPSQPIISIRDKAPKTSNRLLVLVDGREVAYELFGITLWETLGISLGDIKRIEVIRGPGSALYGANAYSGVINIQTKRPGQAEGFDSNITIFSNNYYLLNGYASAEAGDIQYLVSASTAEANDWAEEDKTSFGFQSGRGVVERQFLGGTLGIDLGATYLRSFMPTVVINFDLKGMSNYGMIGYKSERLRLNTYWNRFSFDVTAGEFLKGPEIYAMVQTALQEYIPSMGYDEDKEKCFMGWLDATENNFYDILELGFFDFGGKILSNTYDFSGDYTREFLGWNKIIAGGNFRRSVFESMFFAGEEITEDKMGIFIQDEIKLIDKASLTLGTRYDWSDKINQYISSGIKVKGEVSPRASIVLYPARDHSVRFSVGRAFRKPTALESQVRLVIIKDFFPSEKNLKNEKILTYETGYMGKFLDGKLRLGVDYYYNILSDFIKLKIGKEEESVKYENSAKNMYNYGCEFYLELRPFSWLRSEFNYSYLDVNPDVKPRDYSKNRANFILTLTSKRFITSVYVRYVEGFYDKVMWTDFRLPEDISKIIGFLMNPCREADNEEELLSFADFIEQGGKDDPPTAVDYYIATDIKIGYRITDSVEIGILAKNIGADGHLETSGKVREVWKTYGKNIEGEPIPTYYGAYLKAAF